MADQQWYPQGARPRILINWQSFVDWGIPASWQGAFTDAVINAWTRPPEHTFPISAVPSR